MTDIFKVRAERLGAHLATRHGYHLKHTSLLEAIAAEEGARNWHTLRAGTIPSESHSSRVQKEVARFESFDECKAWTLECLHMADTRHLHIRNAANGAWQIYYVGHTGERKQIAHLTAEQATQLAEYLKAEAGLVKENGQPQEGQFVSTLSRNGVRSEVPFTLVTSPTLYGPYFILCSNRLSRRETLAGLSIGAATAWLEAVTQGPLLTVIAGAPGSGRTATLVSTVLALDSMGRETCFLTGCPAELTALTTLAAHCSVLGTRAKGLAKPLKAAGALSPSHVMVDDYTQLSQEAAIEIATLLRAGVHVSVTVSGGSASGVIRTLDELGLNPQALGMPVGVLCQTVMTERSKDSAHPSRKVLATEYCEVTEAMEGRIESLPFPGTAHDAIRLLELGRITYPTFVRTYGHAGLKHLPERLLQT